MARRVLLLLVVSLLAVTGCDNRCGRRGQDVCKPSSSWLIEVLP